MANPPLVCVYPLAMPTTAPCFSLRTDLVNCIHATLTLCPCHPPPSVIPTCSPSPFTYVLSSFTCVFLPPHFQPPAPARSLQPAGMAGCSCAIQIRAEQAPHFVAARAPHEPQCHTCGCAARCKSPQPCPHGRFASAEGWSLPAANASARRAARGGGGISVSGRCLCGRG